MCLLVGGVCLIRQCRNEISFCNGVGVKIYSVLSFHLTSSKGILSSLTGCCHIGKLNPSRSIGLIMWFSLLFILHTPPFHYSSTSKGDNCMQIEVHTCQIFRGNYQTCLRINTHIKYTYARTILHYTNNTTFTDASQHPALRPLCNKVATRTRIQSSKGLCWHICMF